MKNIITEVVKVSQTKIKGVLPTFYYYTFTVLGKYRWMMV